MTITYRDGTKADAAALDLIFETTFSDTFGHLYASQDLRDFLSGFPIADWEAELTSRDFAFQIAEADGTPIGYSKLGPMTLPVDTEAPALLLKQIYLLNGYHGRGIARALMDWTIDEARRRGARELYLTVYIDNERARRLYDGYGFEAVGDYRFMVGRHADQDVIMRKRL